LGQQHVVGWMILTDAQVAHLPSSLIEQTLVQRLQEDDFLVHGSNLNSKEEIRRAVILGIDQLSTDRLDMALSIREELSA